ncbi:MAG TPA: hypothetical protein VMU54_26270, partial [Planctomycetota bacterium]|nr:hypothetical protein [Planctomycetota bacterium]
MWPTAATSTRILAVLLLSGVGLWALPGAGMLPAPKPRAALNVLFVQAPSGSGGDGFAYNELQRLGYSISIKPSGTVKASDAVGMDLIVVTSTATRSQISTLFTNSTVPLLTWNSGTMSDLGMTGGTSGTDYGTTGSQTAVSIVTPSHPLAAGLTGTVTVTTQGDTYSWGVPSASAILVASLTGVGTR